MQFLENVNQSLQHIVAAAVTDYSIVNDLAKKYYSSQSTPHASEKAEAMIQALQYVDVFSQRISHLVEIHRRMMNEGLAKDFPQSFYHLHVFQAMTIECDLLQSISSIKAILHEVKTEGRTEKIQWLATTPFENVIFIKLTLNRIIDMLRSACGEVKKLPIPTLTAGQANMLYALYTTDEERLVLGWFLDSMPGGNWDDLLDLYIERIPKGKENVIELF
jgi:hypothetical protein